MKLYSLLVVASNWIIFLDAKHLDITYTLIKPGLRRKFTVGNDRKAVFDMNTNYKILCHGWNADDTIPWYPSTIKAYMKIPNINVIAVSYGHAMSDPLYVGALLNVPDLGKMIGDMIIDLNMRHGISYKNIHIIGHSLGAHIAGNAGKTVLQHSRTKISRISGLDPASPGFNLLAKSTSLIKNDAQFVDVIHTSSLGLAQQVGHIDFYPHGGHNQAGCDSSDCSHNVAPEYYASSIGSKQYVATKCFSYDGYIQGSCGNKVTTLLGEYVDRKLRGKFYLDTSNELGVKVKADIQDRKEEQGGLLSLITI